MKYIISEATKRENSNKLLSGDIWGQGENQLNTIVKSGLYTC